MKDNLCKIISNQELSAGYYRLVLEKPFASFQPGQFCMIKVPDHEESLLRHPFSLCREDAKTFELVYKVVGPMTRVMSSLKAGKSLDVFGPLGQGFEWTAYTRVMGIAGGYGIAPMLGLARHLKEEGLDYEVYYGVRAESDLLLIDDFKETETPVHIATEDGSKGFEGQITALIEQDVSRSAPTINDKTAWFVCGPHGLLQAASALAEQLGIDCFVSLEEYMGCGIGVCLGCVVKTKDESYRRSCCDGPVMVSRDIVW